MTNYRKKITVLPKHELVITLYVTYYMYGHHDKTYVTYKVEFIFIDNIMLWKLSGLKHTCIFQRGLCRRYRWFSFVVYVP